LAATFEINNGTDGFQRCTLRAALQQINLGDDAPQRCFNRSSEPRGTNDTILFGVRSVVGISSEISITRAVSINPDGDPVSITGTDTSRIFNISTDEANGIKVTLNNLSLSQGNAENDAGGAIFIRTNARVTLNNTVISNNTADLGGAISIGTGAQATLNNSIIEENTARLGGGIGVDTGVLILNNSQVLKNTSILGGGGIYSIKQTQEVTTEVTLKDSIVTQNSSDADGGGILAADTNLILNNSDIENNQSSSRGGGIAHVVDFDVSVLTIDNSRIRNNEGFSHGGGIFISNSDAVNINNSLLEGNTMTSPPAITIIFDQGGGAIHATNTTLNLNNSTLSGNTSAQQGGAIHATSTDVNCNSSTLVNNEATGGLRGGAIFTDLEATAIPNLNNCLVSNNQVDNLGHEIVIFREDQINFNGTNLLGDSSKTSEQAFQGFTPPQNQIIATSDSDQATSADAIFQPLADNGGPTQTHALTVNSPAIDAGDNSLCNAFSQDQRGEDRIFGENCDIGAYEFQGSGDSFFVIPLPDGKAVVITL